MTPERWKKIDEIAQRAIDLPADERTAFLDSECRGDPDLRRDVESLISYQEDASKFLESPAVKDAALLIANAQSPSLEGRVISHYRLTRRIGQGGMGEVYLAEDTRLNRKVALKMLPSDLINNRERLLRFKQEARAASALNHPNIITIHEIGTSGDTHFIATEFIEGETLRRRLQTTRLEIEETLQITSQIAAALDVAHRNGIVHRDIKPENVMVREDGFVKVLDFGLAKLAENINNAPTDTQSPTQTTQVKTTPGVVLGTVAYMSPEQARGLEIDARTDIFSLGIVLYEMLTGKLPFAGETISDYIASILKSGPAPISRSVSDVPKGLEKIVGRTLRKNRDERYQHTKDFLIDLRDLKQDLEFIARTERAEALTKATPDGVDKRADDTNIKFTGKFKRYHLLAALVLIALLVCAAGFGYFYLSPGKSSLSATSKKTLVVLPFINVSQDPDAEYLAEGITESVINNLSQLSGLKVISRTSSFRFKDNQNDMKIIALQLDVENIISGDIRQIGDRLIINVRLIDAGDDSQVWGHQYVKTPADVITVQNEIARDVSRRLRTRLSDLDEKNLSKKHTDNPQAYQLYLRGRYHLEKYALQDMRKSLAYFQQAVAIDPNFALAYANLAFGYSFVAGEDDFPPRETMLKAKETALKSLSLDDQLSTAHEALGIILWHFDRDYVAAERELKRAIELDSNAASARETYGEFLLSLDRYEESLAESHQAAEIDPLSPSISFSIGKALLYARRYDEAVAQFRKALALDTYFLPGRYGLFVAYQMQHIYAESVEEYAKIAEILGDQKGATFVRQSFANGGWKGFLRTMTENSQAPQASPYVKATMYTELGNKDKAIEILNSLYEEGSRRILEIKVDPRLDYLRDDSRFQDLLRRMNFPP